MPHKKRVSITAVTLFAALFLFMPQTAMAKSGKSDHWESGSSHYGNKHHKHYKHHKHHSYYKHKHHHHYPSYGKIIFNLPHSSVSIILGGKKYYYGEGIYYHKKHHYYVVAEPPGVLVSPPPVIVYADKPAPAPYEIEGVQYITVNVPNKKGGYTAVTLKKTDSEGFIGPQGEFYHEFPSISELKTIYAQ